MSQIRFANKDCRACAVRPACTRAKTEPRTLAVRTQVYHEARQAARHCQTTAEFKEQYALRAGLEGTLSQGVRAFDLRRSRYIGLARTHLQPILLAVAINVVRVETVCRTLCGAGSPCVGVRQQSQCWVWA